MARWIKILSEAVSGTEDDDLQLENRFERYLHFWTHVWSSFVRNRCMIRAAALSYTALLALIPLLAVAISVTSSLLKNEGEQKIYQGIDKFVAAMVPPASESNNVPAAVVTPGSLAVNAANFTWVPTTALTVTNSAGGTNGAAGLTSLAGDARVVSAQKSAARSIHEFVKNMQSATLGVTSMLVLIFVAIRMLASIEATFNDIWGVTRGRTWVWRIVLYWTTITLGPIAVVAAVGLAGGSQLHAVKGFFHHMPFIGGLIFDFLPITLLWLVFAMVYLLVPNTKVKFSAAFVGGLVAGSVWHLSNVFGFLFVTRLVTNSKIYGSLALVPVFMGGLYLSWVILLFGAQVAFAFQNRKSYLQEKLLVNVNQRGREFVALRLMTCLGQRFLHGREPATLSLLAGELGIPAPLALSVLRPLAHERLVSEVNGQNREPAYMPARPLQNITAHDILQAMRTGSGQELPRHDNPALAGIYGEFGRIEQAERAAASVITLQALADRVSPAPMIAAPAASRPDKSAGSQEQTEHEEIAEPPEPLSETPADVFHEEEKTVSATEPAKPPPARPVAAPEENRDFPL